MSKLDIVISEFEDRISDYNEVTKFLNISDSALFRIDVAIDTILQKIDSFNNSDINTEVLSDIIENRGD